MSRYRARHRFEPTPLNAAQRTLATASFGVLATAALAGTTAAWACPSGSHANTRASVHQAVSHGHASAVQSDRQNSDASSTTSSRDSATRTSSGESAGAMRGASPSNPDGMSNGGMDKPWGAAAANDNVDGNNGSGNDLDCEDDNNGVGTPGHCRVGSGSTTHHAGAHGVASVHVSDEVSGEITVVVVLHNGDTTSVTVAAPAAGETVMVPVTVHRVTVTVAVTGTSTGATATAVGSANGSSGNGGETGSGNGSVGSGGGSSAGAGTTPGSTVVLGERFSRGLQASSPAATGASGATTSSVSPTSTALPFTGGNEGVITLVGVSSVLTGAGILRASRRRRGLAAAGSSA